MKEGSIFLTGVFGDMYVVLGKVKGKNVEVLHIDSVETMSKEAFESRSKSWKEMLPGTEEFQEYEEYLRSELYSFCVKHRKEILEAHAWEHDFVFPKTGWWNSVSKVLEKKKSNIQMRYILDIQDFFESALGNITDEERKNAIITCRKRKDSLESAKAAMAAKKAEKEAASEKEEEAQPIAVTNAPKSAEEVMKSLNGACGCGCGCGCHGSDSEAIEDGDKEEKNIKVYETNKGPITIDFTLNLFDVKDEEVCISDPKFLAKPGRKADVGVDMTEKVIQWYIQKVNAGTIEYDDLEYFDTILSLILEEAIGDNPKVKFDLGLVCHLSTEVTDSGINYMLVSCRGDGEEPVLVCLYSYMDKFKTYIPKYGNSWNIFNNSAVGNDEKKDRIFCKYLGASYFSCVPYFSVNKCKEDINLRLIPGEEAASEKEEEAQPIAVTNAPKSAEEVMKSLNGACGCGCGCHGSDSEAIEDGDTEEKNIKVYETNKGPLTVKVTPMVAFKDKSNVCISDTTFLAKPGRKADVGVDMTEKVIQWYIQKINEGVAEYSDREHSIDEIVMALFLNEIKDKPKVNFDLENVYLVSANTTGSGINYMLVECGGDWEVPVAVCLYSHKGKFKTYIPKYGNSWNIFNNSAVGNDEEGDDLKFFEYLGVPESEIYYSIAKCKEDINIRLIPEG